MEHIKQKIVVTFIVMISFITGYSQDSCIAKIDTCENVIYSYKQDVRCLECFAKSEVKDALIDSLKLQNNDRQQQIDSLKANQLDLGEIDGAKDALLDDCQYELKKSRIKEGIWKATSGILGIITLRLLFKN